ncbi:MAG: hypothetical protein FJZ59_02020 [Chlamydiae bacterium]|nr:hypothetical protein [Chlamydiota bacterium]
MIVLRGLVSSNVSSFCSLGSVRWGQYSSSKTPEEFLKGLEKASEIARKIIKDLQEAKEEKISKNSHPIDFLKHFAKK